MAYNFALAILPDSTLEEFEAMDGGLSFDEATRAMPGELHAALVGPHVVIVDPMYGEAVKMLVDNKREHYLVILGGTADQYVIQAIGPTERLRVLSAGEVVEDEGEPLPAEVVLTEAEWPEDAHLLVIERLLGTSFTEVMNADFHPLAFRL
jgi:hypothetical protein